MSLFSDIPVRSNADTGLVTASWWNSIRTALVNAFGDGGIIAETQKTIVGTQSSYADITGFKFDQTTTSAQTIHYTIYRTDGTTSRRELGALHGWYHGNEGTWSWERESRGSDALNVSNSLTVDGTTGQVSYKSDAYPNGTILFKSVIVFSQES